MDCPHCGTPTVVPVEFHGFLLLHPLGFGGMGTVYKALDLTLNRLLAIKILRRKLASNSQFMENFRREAQAAAAVNHANVARVFSFGEHEGQCYLVMELLERGSLDDRLTKIGKVPEKEALDIGIQIARGLKAAYETGLLHRDVKPGNILFNEQGVPKIVDFGLARPTDASAAGDASDTVWGTPYYIAPEKLTTHREDFRSDIYSLGATLFHAMTGRPPFEAATAADVAMKHATTPAHSLKTYLPSVQETTAQVIGRMLAKNPADRYDSYDALIADLEKAKSVLEEAEQKHGIVTETGERLSIFSVVATVLGVGALVAAGVLVWLNRDKFFGEEPPPPPVSQVVTQRVVKTAIKVEEVNFNHQPSWREAAQQMAEGKMASALFTYEALQKQFRSQPHYLRWLFYAEGVALLLNNQPQDSRASFAKAQDPVLPPQVPPAITPINFVSPLASVMLQKLPQADMDKAAPTMPRWASHLNDFNAGLLELRARRFTNAVPRLARFAKAPAHAEYKWMYEFQAVASELLRDCAAVTGTVAQAEQLYKQGKLPLALKTCKEQQARIKIPLLAAHIEATANSLRQRDEEQRKRLEQQRLAAEMREREEQQKRQLELQRQQQEADARLLAAAEADAPKLLATYDFKKLLETYQNIQPKLQTPDARARVERDRARIKALADLKETLAAAFERQPFNGEDIKQTGAAFIGKLSRATDTQLVFVLDFGDSLREWRELQPTTIVNLATAYARLAKEDQQALWYFRIAVFCKQYGLDRFVDAYAQLAVKLQPALQTELNQLLGN